MAASEVKLPKKGAVARIRHAAEKLRKQPVGPGLREVLKKKPETGDEQPLKKIARNKAKRDPDLGL